MRVGGGQWERLRRREGIRRTEECRLEDIRRAGGRVMKRREADTYIAMGRGRRSRIVAYVMGARVAIFAEEGVILVVACVTGV